MPNIDFGWNGGTVSPEFRRYILDRPDALFEKCIIYDGGARRYEIPVHFEEVLDYWEGILERADSIDMEGLAEEKLGYRGLPGYEEWLVETGLASLVAGATELFAEERYGSVSPEFLRQLWEDELALRRRAAGMSLRSLAERRINEIKSISQRYE